MWVDLQYIRENGSRSKTFGIKNFKLCFKTELTCENDVQLQVIGLILRKMKQMNDTSSTDFTFQAKKGRLKLKRV